MAVEAIRKRTLAVANSSFPGVGFKALYNASRLSVNGRLSKASPSIYRQSNAYTHTGTLIESIVTSFLALVLKIYMHR